ncbi:unnamed protein product, partial [Polarella glacialis]
LHCSTRRCQLWASVIEKAFAKACGSYEALASGTCDEALSVLTGWPCTVIHFSREDFDADMLWHALIEGRVDKFLMTCSSADRNDRYQTGLKPSHAYSLLDVTDTRDQNGSRLQLLKLGDPHFHIKRRGAWSDTSHSWPPELRRQLRVSDAAAAGIFFLELSEFLQWFDNCTICRVRDDWTRVDLTTELAGNRVPSEGWVLQVTQPTQCAICLTQPELCTRRQPLQCLGFVLFFFDSATGGARVVASANLHCRAASVDDCWLTPGQLYYLLPLCRPSVRSLPVLCSCSSSRPVVVSQRSFEQSVVQVAWAAFIKCRGSKEASGEAATGGQLSLFGFMSVRNDSEDLRVFVAKTSDGAVVALAENHGLADISVELGFHQSHQRGLRFSRDGPVTCDRVQPGRAQLLQLALPEASWSRAPSFEIRRLRPSIGARQHFAAQSEASPAAFSNSEFRPFPILEIRQVTSDTKILKCKLPTDSHTMGMTVSGLVMVNGEKGADGTAVARPYTPISLDDQTGYFELMVKGYPTGIVSKYLCSLKPGDSLEVKGPFTKLPYTANMKKQIGMIAGGSGITPMVQVVKEILKNPADKTQVTLIYGNQSPTNIPLRAELDNLVASSKGQLAVHYIVDKNDTNDSNIAHVGFVDAGLCAGLLPPPSPDNLVYICGPPGMLISVAGNKKFEEGKPPAQGELAGVLKELGYTEDMVFKL